MLKNDPTPPTNPGVSSRFHPSNLVAVKKTLFDENLGGVCDNRILFPTRSISFSHQHVVRNNCADSASPQHPLALRGESSDQINIVFVAGEQVRIVKRSVVVGRRCHDQRDLFISHFIGSHLSDVPKENLQARRPFLRGVIRSQQIPAASTTRFSCITYL